MALFLDHPAAFVRNGGSNGLANNAPDHPIWVKFARAMGPSRVPLATKIASELAVFSPARRWMSPPDMECSASRSLEPSRTRKSRRSTARRPFSCPRERQRGGCVGPLPHVRGQCVRHRLGQRVRFGAIGRIPPPTRSRWLCDPPSKRLAGVLVSGGRAAAVEFC